MPLLRLLCLILLAPPAFAANITLDRGPTGDRAVTVILTEPSFTNGLLYGYREASRRKEESEDFGRRNGYFVENGLTPDGAGNAYSEVGRFARDTFLNGRVFRLTGSIQSGDTQRLAALAEPYLRSVCTSGQNCPYSAVLSLDSPGGSFAEAIRLAEFINKWSLVTVVDKGDRCESACALIFLSGHDVFRSYPSARRFAHLDSRIGIHQPLVELDETDVRVRNAAPSQLFRLANLAIGEVTGLFLKTGISIGALERMYATPPEEMYHLSPFQLIAENVRVFDDNITEFRGARSDLIAMCARRLEAISYSGSSEIIANFQMRGSVFVTFDAGRNFLCTGKQDDEGYWRVMMCRGMLDCRLWDFLADQFQDGKRPEERFEGPIIWLTERGYLGFVEYAHRGILIEFMELHHDEDQASMYDNKAYTRLQIPAAALPMPPELCGKLDEAHPELVLTVQRKLATYGFDAGGADGSLGPKTRAAVQAANAQIAPNAPPGNRITPALLRAMRVPQTTIDRFTLCHPTYRD